MTVNPQANDSAARFLLTIWDVYAIPHRLQRGVSQVSGISCPDCGGVLEVQAEGRDATLLFECRIAHTFDVPELLAAKEERLEDFLWEANRALHELAALLSDLAVYGEDHGESRESIRAFRSRAAQAKATAVAVRTIINDSRPIDLAAAEPGGSQGCAPGGGRDA